MKKYFLKSCKLVVLYICFTILPVPTYAKIPSLIKLHAAGVEEQGRIMSEVITCYENDQYEEAQRLNDMLPEYADDPTESELTDDMKKAYKEKIESYYGYKSSDKNYLVNFYLSDVNNDKVCDLILRLGESRQGDRCEAYTFLDNKISLVSSSVAPDSLCDYPNHKGVLSVGFNNATYERYLYILLYENKSDSFKTLKKCMSYLDLRCKLKSYLIKREENKVYFECKLLTSSTSTINGSSENTEKIYADDITIKVSDVIGENKTFADYIKNVNSKIYNPLLSYMLCGYARASYEEKWVKDSLVSCGFNEIYTDYDPNITVAYTIARKTLSDNSLLVMIIIRGSYEFSWINNANFGILARNGIGKHAGFEGDALRIYNKLISLTVGLKKSNVRYVITGHSQGAAAANLLSVKLNDNGVPSEAVYNYNFACPNVACLVNPLDWNPGGIHDNIFNIGNLEDPVTFVPSNLIMRSLVNPLATWGKFGKTFWFEPSEGNHNFAGHDLKYYMKDMYNMSIVCKRFYSYQEIPAEIQVNVIKTFPKFILNIIGIHCPVDIKVEDEKGNIIAETINNKAKYYINSNDMILITEGDEKWVLYTPGKQYRLILTGNDTGTMKCDAYKANLVDGTTSEVAVFENVQLNKGKKFKVETNNNPDKTEIYVTDNSGSVTAEVKKNGEEVAVNGSSSESLNQTGVDNQTGNESTKQSETTVQSSVQPSTSGLYSPGQVSVTSTATVSETTPVEKTHVTTNSVTGRDPYTGATETIDTFANGTATVLSVDNALKLTGVVTYDGLNYKVTRFSTDSFSKVSREKVVIDLKTSGNTEKVVLMAKAFKGSGIKTLSLKLTSADQVGFKKGALSSSKIEKVAVYGLTKSEFNRVKRKLKASGYTGKVVRK